MPSFEIQADISTSLLRLGQYQTAISPWDLESAGMDLPSIRRTIRSLVRDIAGIDLPFDEVLTTTFRSN